MSDVLFSRVNVLKRDIYSTICNLLTNAGWQNISTKPAADGDVFFSTGIDGLHELYLNFVPGTFATADATLNISTYTCRKYVPASAAGTSGVFTRRSTVTDLFFRENNTVTAQKILTTTPYILWYNVDKNRIIFIVEPFPGYGVPCVIVHFGLPNEIYLLEDIDTGVVTAYSCRSTLSKCYANDYSIRTSITDKIQHNIITNVPVGEKTASGKRMMSPIYYGNPNDGIRGKIDGLFTLTNSIETCGKGTMISDSKGKQYRIAITTTPNATYPYDSSFTSHVIAFQVG